MAGEKTEDGMNEWRPEKNICLKVNKKKKEKEKSGKIGKKEIQKLDVTATRRVKTAPGDGHR